jgi:signal transduction histidine kinase
MTVLDDELSREDLLEELAILRARNALLEELVVVEAPKEREPAPPMSFLAHKIRNLLNCTLGFASLLEEETRGMLNEEQRYYVSRIGNSVDLMLNLVTELVEQAERPEAPTHVELRT